ncbi:protein ZNF365-like [Takifugu rubripes]|uniref:Protein ZNF365-like n=1 Tax=Takifugu rubripes TaxID=31033 RepID=A0A674PH41_TAKRU|nr:protein ZNF365-like [Takifugu rubripes]XP_029691010.1 protein ZNF365-like [Takifugu rubripes]|eukprot:XP_011601296.1 PREDICTED: protein ZNF365 [Takifugu rubripes]
MQQKLHCKGSGSFLLERNGQACGANVLSSDSPLHCPRCGSKRFCSLASLCTHLEYRHSSRPPEELTTGFSITGKPPDPLTSAAIPWHDTSPPAYRGQQSTQQGAHAHSLSDNRDYSFAQASERRRTQSVGVGTQVETGPDDAQQEEGEKREGSMDKGCFSPLRLPFSPADRPLDLDLEPDLDLNLVEPTSFSRLETAAASSTVHRQLAGILRAADGTMQQQLVWVSTELAQTDTELLCERAHSQHLAQERQEVAERERSLSRQVDVAVVVIAALREQLNASENQLEQREREVITIQKFLDVATRQEKSGKVRIQRFIEDLLSRIALAERLLDYYQANGSHQQEQPTDIGSRLINNSKSTGGQLSFSGLCDNRNYPSQSGGQRLFCQSGADRERLAQSSRLFCRPELRDDIWNQNWRRSAGHEA